MIDRLKRTLTLTVAAVAVVAVGCSANRPVEQPEQSELSSEVQLTPDTYESIVHSEQAALIDFSADWCGPCQLMKPEVARIAEDMKGELVVAIADMTDNESAPAAPAAVAWKVEGYPTFILVRNGQELGRRSGSMPSGELTSWVRENL